MTLSSSETKTIPCSLPLPLTLKEGGPVKLTLSFSSGDQIKKEINLATKPVVINQNIIFDKTSYRIRENLGINCTITNDGNFASPIDVSFRFSIPDMNYTYAGSLTLEPLKDVTVPLTIPIPENLLAGSHNVRVDLTLPWDTMTWQNLFVVHQSSLSTKYGGPDTPSAGDNLGVTIENTGGVDTGYNLTFYLYDKTGWDIDAKNGTGSIQAGAQNLMSYTLPDQLSDGAYQLGVVVTDTKTDITTYYYSASLNISGLKDQFSVRSDKDVYFSNEETITLSSIVNQGKAMVDGNLYLEIYCAESAVSPSPPPALASFHIYTMDNPEQWTEHGVLHFSNYFDRQELPLPILTGQVESGGTAYVSIQQEGSQIASLDYVALKGSDGNPYAPNLVSIYEHDITPEVQTEDGNSAEITGGVVYAYWDNLPSGVSYALDPTGQYTSVGEQSFSLSVPENSLVRQVSPLTTSVSGIHRLVHGIYGPEELLLCSGSEAFDVGDAVIMGISTDKRDYPTNTEPVTVTASLFGSVAANLDFELDGSVVKSETISLNGFTPYTTQLQNIIPGPHTLKATLTAGGLKSTKEISFTYAQAYMVKPQISASPASLDFGSINLGSSSTKTATLSSTGNVGLVIGTIILSGTNQGEFSIQNDNCSGRTIVPSRNCTLDVFFSPASLGARSASLSVSSNGIDTPTLHLSLGGAGAATLIVSINPSGSGRVTGTGIDCPGDCTESFATAGATIQLTVTPTEGYRFVNWTGDVNSAENSVTVNMDTHKNMTASFAINPFTVIATGGLGGIISPSGSVTVNYGGSQTFTIMPNAGYHVVDVKVDRVSVGVALAYTFSNVTSDHTVEVIFGINQYTLIATAGSNGAIVPYPDYRISDVKVDGESTGPVATYTFTNVTAAHTIEASFAINQHTIISTAGSDGTITLSGAISMDHGGSQTFTITPNSGYRISDVEVDGVMLGVTKSYTFGNVAADHTIRATFKQIQLVNLPFSDDLEDDPVGTQPNLPWDSFNGGSAIVTSSGSHSLANSIFVSNGSEGSGSAFVNLGDTYPDRIAYEVWAKVNSTASGAYVGFCEEILGIVPQFNAVYFNGTEGKIYLTSTDREHGFTIPLLDSFAVGVWHKVRVQIDFTDLIADVFIDDVLVGSGLQVSPKNATWEHGGTYFFQLNKVGVAHGLGEAIRFDDFSVSEWNSNTPVNLLRSAGPGQWALLGMGGIGSASSTSISMSGSSSVRGTVLTQGLPMPVM